MGIEEKETEAIDELAAKMGQDIVTLNKKAAEVKLPGDLREIDLAPLVPPVTTGLFRTAFSQLAAESAKVRQEHEARIEEQSQALEESVSARRQAMTQRMSELEKAETEAGASAQVVRLRMNQEVKRYEQHVVELQLDKKVRPGRIVVRPDVAQPDVTPAKKVTKKPTRKSPSP